MDGATQLGGKQRGWGVGVGWGRGRGGGGGVGHGGGAWGKNLLSQDLCPQPLALAS